MIEQQLIDTQQVLDELLSKKLIPFALTAYGVNPNGRGEYVVPFNDSRIHSFRFAWKEGENFKETVRAAVLERVNRMSGPLQRKTAASR
jgi:hypothetical protein